MIISCDVLIEWSDLHLREFERVTVTFPAVPDDTVTWRAVVGCLVFSVQVGFMAVVEPKGTSQLHGACVTIVVVVLVSGAELLSQMVGLDPSAHCHRVAFKQQHVHKPNCM